MAVKSYLSLSIGPCERSERPMLILDRAIKKIIEDLCKKCCTNRKLTLSCALVSG